jgi:membrane protein implicated in regulation of membrane protease activity
LTHSEFREGYRQGAIRVQVDRALAAKYLSSRLWLPVVVTPVIGGGAALALWSWVWQGLTLVALGLLLPQLVRASAPYFVLTQALEDETVYQEVFSGHILSVTSAAAEEREKV